MCLENVLIFMIFGHFCVILKLLLTWCLAILGYLKNPYTIPIRSISIILKRITGLLKLFDNILILIINSKSKTVKNAPNGSMSAKTPFIIPTELPKKKPSKRRIKNNEYLLQGFKDQSCNRSKAFPKFRFKLVD